VRVPMRLLVGLLGLVAVASGQSSSTLDFYVQINNAPLDFNVDTLASNLPNGSTVLTYSSPDTGIELVPPTRCAVGHYCPMSGIPIPCPQGTYNNAQVRGHANSALLCTRVGCSL
jgi:hypothetical protein